MKCDCEIYEINVFQIMIYFMFLHVTFATTTGFFLLCFLSRGGNSDSEGGSNSVLPYLETNSFDNRKMKIKRAIQIGMPSL